MNQYKPAVKARINALTNELDKLMENPRVVDILLNEWLHAHCAK